MEVFKLVPRYPGSGPALVNVQMVVEEAQELLKEIEILREHYEDNPRWKLHELRKELEKILE